MAHIKVIVGRNVVRFPAALTPEAMRFARDMSERTRFVEVVLTGPRGGLVGQYSLGRVTPEFRSHDRAAGLRSSVTKS